MPAMLIVDPDAPLEFWEYPCQAVGCDYVYRFTKQNGWLSWEPIESLTVPDSRLPWSHPVDAFAILERRLRERRRAA